MRVTISYNLLQIIVELWSLNIYFFFTKLVVSKLGKTRQEFQEPTWTVVAISNVPWFATTVEGPFGVGTGGIFTTIVRVIQAFVWVWVIILVMLNFFYLDKQIVVNITIYLTVKNTFPFSQWFQNMTSVTS